MKKIYYLTIVVFFSILLTHCGYTLRRSGSPVLNKMGIERVYIKPLENKTLAAGAENTLYNALLRNIATHRLVTITDDKSTADAVILGTIQRAEFSPSQATTVDQIEPIGTATDTKRVIATYYKAYLTVSFAMYRYSPKHGIANSPLISSKLSRNKTFVASNYLGVLGTTSSILNESGFRRAINDLSDQLSADLNESMLSFF